MDGSSGSVASVDGLRIRAFHQSLPAVTIVIATKDVDGVHLKNQISFYSLQPSRLAP